MFLFPWLLSCRFTFYTQVLIIPAPRYPQCLSSTAHLLGKAVVTDLPRWTATLTVQRLSGFPFYTEYAHTMCFRHSLACPFLARCPSIHILSAVRYNAQPVQGLNCVCTYIRTWHFYACYDTSDGRLHCPNTNHSLRKVWSLWFTKARPSKAIVFQLYFNSLWFH